MWHIASKRFIDIVLLLTSLSVLAVLRRDGVVEGDTGATKEKGKQ